MKKVISILILLILALCPDAYGEDKLRIVATLSTFADIAQSIGGERVEVRSIAPPRFNPHFIEPKPSDVLRLKRADLFLHSGLDLEPWRDPLIDAAARAELRRNGERQLDLSAGIALLEVPSGQVSRSEGDIHQFGNPHYWLDPRNGAQVAKTIAAKLQQLDPANREVYAANLERFLVSLNSKYAEWKELVSPYSGAKVVGYHNEWLYLMSFMGLKMERFLEPKPGIPPTPGQIASVIDYVKSEKVKAIVQPSFYSTDAADDVAAKTGATVVTACQNVNETSEVGDYISMLDYNVRKIVEALKP